VFAALATSTVALALLIPRLATATVTGPAHETCVKTFQMQRQCTAQFIPALVDLRISLAEPRFMADEAAKPGGREALIQQALGEWKDDSADGAIDKTCSHMTAWRNAAAVAKADACLAATDCDAFVACVMPLVKENL